ncbi:MAG TPA: surface lipoprotein assembly modifier, partial [Allosphingosinicella sp.]
AAQPSTEGPVTLQLDGAGLLNLAQMTEREGKAERAETLYRALLADPHVELRSEAGYQLARLLAARGRNTEAAGLLRRVLDEQPQAVPVRLAMAQLLVALGDETAARRELRAAQAGRPPAQVARLIDSYAAALRDRRPFGGEIRLSLAPDSNINRATASDRLNTVIGEFDIAEEGRARSGVGAAMEVSAFARQPLSAGLSLIVQAGGKATRYRKAEFNRLTLQARAGAQLARGASRLSVAIAHQRQRIGGELALTSLGIEADGSHPLSGTAQLRFSAGAAKVGGRLNRLEHGHSFALGGAIDMALSPAAGISLSGSANRRTARDAAYATRSFELGAAAWRDFGRLTVGGSATVGRLRADDRLFLLPERRKDRSATASLTILSRHLAFQGLAPSLRFTIERNRSNIAFYDTHRRALELAFSRAF